MLHIWGRPTSICTQRVLWACAEAGVPYELTLASATMGPDGHVSTGAEPFGSVGSDWYGELNPNHTVPTINDDGFVLWESNAIVIYIALRYGGGTLTDGLPQTTAHATAWMSWTNEHFEPPLHTLVMELSRLTRDLRTPGNAAAAVELMAPSLELLDAHLANQPYVASDRFTMGDIPTGAAARRWKVFAQPGPSTPHLDAWLERLGEREGFTRHVEPAEFHV